MLFLDPPDHTRLRALVNKALPPTRSMPWNPGSAAFWGPCWTTSTTRRFRSHAGGGQPLPVIVIAEMLGVPPEDRDRFKVWSAQRARLLEPTISRRERKVGVAASRAFDAYFRPIIEARWAAPRDDIVSALAQAEDEGERLTERETLNMLRLLLSAGNETTANLIGNGILALLRHPDELQRLREDPSLIPGAVEELLRFDSPVQADFRRVLADCEINGFALRKRDNIVALIGAANRESGRVREPGPARCEAQPGLPLGVRARDPPLPGAPLARLESRVVLEMLLERFSQISLFADPPRFRKTIVLRGLQSLPVRCVRA